jgi:hypothetical protein
LNSFELGKLEKPLSFQAMAFLIIESKSDSNSTRDKKNFNNKMMNVVKKLDKSGFFYLMI